MISLIGCLGLGNEFKVKSNLDIEESDSIALVCDFDMRALFELFMSLRNT